MRVLLFCLLLSGCMPVFFNKPPEKTASQEIISTARQFNGLSEYHNRHFLTKTMGVDPVNTEWCAAFVNAILDLNDIKGSESVSQYPLLARSFLRWGYAVSDPRPGDIIVFPRGSEPWQGHVAIHYRTIYFNGNKWYWVLGGNQNDRVSFRLYPASYAIGVRRSFDDRPSTEDESIVDNITPDIQIDDEDDREEDQIEDDREEDQIEDDREEDQIEDDHDDSKNLNTINNNAQ